MDSATLFFKRIINGESSLCPGKGENTIASNSRPTLLNGSTQLTQSTQNMTKQANTEIDIKVFDPLQTSQSQKETAQQVLNRQDTLDKRDILKNILTISRNMPDKFILSDCIGSANFSDSKTIDTSVGQEVGP